MPDRQRHVCFNEQAHDAVSGAYEERHSEIFNPIEQDRLHESLREAIQAVRTISDPRVALDYGCGSGNVTAHLIDLGLHTTSADVSQAFLDLIGGRFGPTGRSRTLKVNGTDLAGVPDGAFDFVATYSVLHHVPDYLAMVRELCRVIKPGGVLYIDHEVNEFYWSRPAEYIAFLKAARPRIDVQRCFRLAFDVKGYKHIFRRLFNPRYKREGDIHVWPDDHIEWDKIEDVLCMYGFEIVFRHDYLLYRSLYKRHVYEGYRGRCTDQRVLVARRSLAPSVALGSL